MLMRWFAGARMWMTMNAPPSGCLRDLVRRRLVTRPHLLTHSKPLPRLRLTALMTASDLLGTLWTVLGIKLPFGNHLYEKAEGGGLPIASRSHQDVWQMLY